ncbi:MAG: nicotinate-nucleotide adenylyltransferase [Bacteroidota bacterium]
MDNLKLKIMKTFFLGLFVFGLTIQSFAQETEVLDVRIAPASYKYINKVTEDSTEVSPAEPVNFHQQRTAIFNLENSKYYQDEYDYYFLSFFIPEGKILASYDAEGNILRTIEKLKNTETPPVVARAVKNRYPGWIVSDYVYLVNHHFNGEIDSKEYKLLLEKGTLRMRIRTDEKGNFIKSKV